MTQPATTTELTTTQPTAIAQTGRGDELNSIWKHARMLAESDIVPAAYRGKPANCVIAIEMAERLNTVAMMVMQNLYVIQGNPSWSSKFLIGSVNVSKRFTPIRYRYEGKENTKDWSCRAVATDVETKEELVGPRISIAMADAEGWTKKAGSKWLTMPEMMLAYRAAAFWTRLYCPEISMGLLTTEEAEDIIHAPPMQRVGMPEDLRAVLGAAPSVTVPEPRREVPDAEVEPETAPTREPGQEG